MVGSNTGFGRLTIYKQETEKIVMGFIILRRDLFLLEINSVTHSCLIDIGCYYHWCHNYTLVMYNGQVFLTEILTRCL